ncbi:zinc-ribbon domain-containing protein [Streptococcus equi subsp. zooepidemicus]|uniref:zinc-ribbon domain-containing protein n=1 Tax=Streptococcus equi TaxID=1336 RepID=UPI0024A910DE|nr:zinc-ribbon domain-containing protein [Streptococcus equi]MDI5913494.1 zinc-ribbon domain-containing protein [Streptococcus equi subsp. zooepidemicus]
MESERIYASLRKAYRNNRLTEDQVVRLQKIGFPFTSRKEIILGVNDLATLFPDLAKEWDEEKNGPLELNKVHIGSAGCFWWVCPKCGLSYRQAIRRRTGQGDREAVAVAITGSM